MRAIMKRSISISMLALAAILLALWGCMCQREIPREAQVELQYFLGLDHEDVMRPQDDKIKPVMGNNTDLALQGVRNYADALEPRLIELLKNGPDDDTLKKVRSSLEEQWKRRQAFLGKNPKLPFSDKELKVLRNVSKEAYVKQGSDHFVRKYREKSAVALAAIGSEKAKKALQEAREGGDESLKSVIDAALERFQ
jgi:hypothetical protein